MSYIWADENQVSYRNLSVSEILTGKNLRSDVGDVSELSESISSVGIIEPLIVNHDADGYHLVAGERRLRAAESIGLTSVPCKIFENMTDAQFYEVMLAENFNREAMSPIDEAKAFRLMLDNYGYTQEYLGGVVGRSQSYIANHLRLLDLPEDIQKLVTDGTLTVAHAMKILSCRDFVLYDQLLDHFSRNIPASMWPVSKFRDQFLSSAYSVQAKAGKAPDYVSSFNVGDEVYTSRCQDCHCFYGHYCYDHECFVKFSSEYSAARAQEVSSEAPAINSTFIREVSNAKCEYLSDLKASIIGDIQKSISGIPVQELFDRFLDQIVPVVDEDDDRFTTDEEGFINILEYDCQEYVSDLLTRDMSLDDFIRILIGALIRDQFLWDIDYETEGDLPVVYQKILKAHGLYSSRFDSHRVELIQADLDFFDKKISDLKNGIDDGSFDSSALPHIEEGCR